MGSVKSNSAHQDCYSSFSFFFFDCLNLFIKKNKQYRQNEKCVFQLPMVLVQGVLEAIRISCAGYPTKRTFDDFLDRFGMLAPDIMDGLVHINFQQSLCLL